MLNIKLKTQKGITLIALVVTIVVLVILAGVSINIVFSNGGILDKAKSAEKRSTIAKEKEIVEMAYLAVSTENIGGEITLEDLQAELENMVGANKTVTTLDENGYLLVKFLETGNEYNINEMGVGKTAEETFSEIATETKIYTNLIYTNYLLRFKSRLPPQIPVNAASISSTLTVSAKELSTIKRSIVSFFAITLRLSASTHIHFLWLMPLSIALATSLVSFASLTLTTTREYAWEPIIGSDTAASLTLEASSRPKLYLTASESLRSMTVVISLKLTVFFA